VPPGQWGEASGARPVGQGQWGEAIGPVGGSDGLPGITRGRPPSRRFTVVPTSGGFSGAAPSPVITARGIKVRVIMERIALPTAIDRLIELDEQESAEQRERVAYLSMMDAVVEALPDALIATDAAGKIVLFNEKAEFMFGLHRSELIGESVERLMPRRYRARHAHDREMYNKFEFSSRSGTMGVGRDLVAIRSDGSEFPVEITLGRMVVPRGILNLALVRFSPQANDEKTTPSRPEPEIEDADAKR
jgi:PAS domain S-box-containing protein